MTHPVPRSRLGGSLAALAASLLAAGATVPAHAGTLFGAAEVAPERFVIVAAPIGDGTRSQLNIYEQVSNRRPCFAVGEGKPAAVNPLLASFDFTGVCSRYIDANGFSVRVGGTDLATVYRLMVTRSGSDIVLLAIPTKSGAGPEMVVARSGGSGSGFLKLELEPGWKLMRRQFQGRSLGHLYLYSDDWPGATAAQAGPSTPAATLEAAPPAAAPITGSGPSSAAVPAPAVAPPALPAPRP